MANIKSALKRIRSSARKRARNKPIDSALKTFVKSANVQIATTGNDSVEAVMRAISALDKAAGKGIIHKNQAARRKSRLMAKLNTAPSREETMAAAAASNARPSRRKSQ